QVLSAAPLISEVELPAEIQQQALARGRRRRIAGSERRGHSERAGDQETEAEAKQRFHEKAAIVACPVRGRRTVSRPAAPRGTCAAACRGRGRARTLAAPAPTRAAGAPSCAPARARSRTGSGARSRRALAEERRAESGSIPSSD